MKEKKWLLLFALVLIGVLGNCEKSYAAIYTTEECLDYMQKCLIEEDENLYVNEEAMTFWEELKTRCDNYSIINQPYGKTAVIQDIQGYTGTSRVWMANIIDDTADVTAVRLGLFTCRVDEDGTLLTISSSAGNGSKMSCLYTDCDYSKQKVTNGVCTFNGGGDNVVILDMMDESAYNYGYPQLYTNVPIYMSDDEEGIIKYLETGDSSGAVNASIINPEPETSYTNKNLYLKNIQYSGVYLTSKPISNAYGEWSYFPVYDGYDIGDCSIEFFYNWDGGFTLLDQPSEGFQISESSTNEVPLETFRNSMRLSPYAIISTMCYEYVFPLNTWIPDCSFGGSFTGVDSGVNFNGFKFDTSDILKTGSSILKVSFRLKAKDGNNYNYGRMYTYTIDLLTGETEEYLSSVDEDGNYTNKEQYKVYDTDGNVTVKTDATSGGSSSSSDNSFTVQDGAIQINVNPTFNVEGGAGGNGGDGGDGGNGGSGGWSFNFGSSGDSDGDDDDGVHGVSIKEFLALITGGIGLLGSNGLVSMLAETFSFVPEDFWRVVIFGMVAMIIVGIMRKF